MARRLAFGASWRRTCVTQRPTPRPHWSQKNWQQVTNERNASEDRKNIAVRENLGGVQPYANPFGEDRKVELPLTYRHYWMDRQGNVVGTDDPNANPNQGSNNEWRSMNRAK